MIQTDLVMLIGLDLLLAPSFLVRQQQRDRQRELKYHYSYFQSNNDALY